MKTYFKKLLLPFLFILAFAFTQQVQAQEIKVYATVNIWSNTSETGFVIIYPDGTTEKGKLELLAMGNLKKADLVTESNGIKINSVFNMLAQKGYKLVSGGITTYIFEK